MIKRYNLHALWIDQIHGVAVVHRSWKYAHDENIFDEKMDVGSLEAALQKIHSEKKTWLLTVLENWLWNKRKVFESSSDPKVLKNIELLFEKLKQYQGQSVPTIAERILKGRIFYESLLPSPNNPSYETAKNDLEQIIHFCMHEHFLKNENRTV